MKYYWLLLLFNLGLLDKPPLKNEYFDYNKVDHEKDKRKVSGEE